jgi:diacylglycerol kinase
MRAVEYSLPAHRSLFEPELTLRIPQTGLLVVLVFGLFFGMMLEMYVMLIPDAILYILMRIMTKRDPYMVDIIIEHIGQKEVFLP